MRKWIPNLLIGLAVIPIAPVHAQSTSGGGMGSLVVVVLILGGIIVASALVLRRFKFARKGTAKAPRVAPAPPAPVATATSDTSKAVPVPSAAEEDAAYEAEQRKRNRLRVILRDTTQSVALIAAKREDKETALAEQADLLNTAKQQHDAAFAEIQATRGLLDFHKRSLQHMGEADTHRKMELQDAIREASLAVIQTDKEQAEREERIRLHQSRIADLKQECDFLSEEEKRLTHEAKQIEQRLEQGHLRHAA
ncbi:MAG: hypothetical protein AAGJ10_12880 [Bacteroidota bacterium]